MTTFVELVAAAALEKFLCLAAYEYHGAPHLLCVLIDVLRFVMLMTGGIMIRRELLAADRAAAAASAAAAPAPAPVADNEPLIANEATESISRTEEPQERHMVLPPIQEETEVELAELARQEELETLLTVGLLQPIQEETEVEMAVLAGQEELMVKAGLTVFQVERIDWGHVSHFMEGKKKEAAKKAKVEAAKLLEIGAPTVEESAVEEFVVEVEVEVEVPPVQEVLVEVEVPPVEEELGLERVLVGPKGQGVEVAASWRIRSHRIAKKGPPVSYLGMCR